MAPKAATKAAAKPAPAAPAPKAAAAAPAAKAPVKVLATLEEKKKYVRSHEMKIDDTEQDLSSESDRKLKKELENKLKSLQQDETYKKAKEDIREAEAQAKIDAERAALANNAKKTDKADSASASEANAGDASSQVSEVHLLSQEKAEEIKKALSASGKDAAAAKAAAVADLEKYAASTPFVLPRIDDLVALFADSKLGGPSLKAATAIVTKLNPAGHGLASCVIPAILTGMNDKKWKTKAACIEVMVACLGQMHAATPAQLAICLPSIVSKLAEAALEVRSEIRTATGKALRELGGMVASPEIKTLSQDLVTAMAEPTNQKHTQAVLAKMGNQTFMSLIDPASLSLLMPIVVRGLKEREAASKKWSAQIFGSIAMLVSDVDILKPYLKTVVPLLRTCLSDVVAEVQREAAKAFGIFEQVFPQFSRSINQPWLFKTLRQGSVGEQIGAALGLAEVFNKMDVITASKLIPEVQAGVMDEKWSVRRGFLELMDSMPQAMKMEFVPYIAPLFPTMLLGITGDKDPVEDPAQRAALALVQRFGDLCPDQLLPSYVGTYCTTLNSVSREESARKQVVREKAAMLLGKMVEKVLEHKKFGQDLLTTDECSNKATREGMLCLVFIMRHDPDAGVKRFANAAWKAAGGAPKVQKILAPALLKMCTEWLSGKFGAGAKKVATETLDVLVKAGDIESFENASSDVEVFAYPTIEKREHAESASVVRGEEKSSLEEATSAGADAKQSATQSEAENAVLKHASMSSAPEDVHKYFSVLIASIVQECIKKKFSGPKITKQVTTGLENALVSAGPACADLKGALAEVAEASVRAAVGEVYDAQQGQEDGDDEILLECDNLLLMYGAGHLLLKDTRLEMRKNKRYGIVAQNGAGKTTLMKEIVNRRIIGMPESLKCVHVDDSKLSLMSGSSLTCLEYVIKMALEMDVTDAGRPTLLKVGFTDKMLDEPVSDLSTGWRMRLTLAVSMLKHADLVLLDEPTNHLDEESVAWLAEYILSMASSSVMVISHEPKFLNKVCTHIVAYKDKKLEYTDGNFDVFAAKMGLNKDQIDKMLSGNLSFDTEAVDEDGEGGEGKEGGSAPAPVAAPIAGPPKLSFPIPGSMEGVKSGSRSVLEIKNLAFRFSKDKDYLFKNANAKLSLNSRVAITGRNGCGKSTLMTLLCSELSPSENEDAKFGDVWRHCNLRMAYMKQDHLKALGPFFATSPFVYITTRFKDGYDGDLQKRLIEPEDADESVRRMELAQKYGKYGNPVEELVTRTKNGSTLMYEVKWAGLDDPKQNTLEPISKLKAMGLEKVIIACDERIAAKAAGLDQRPLTRREVVKHCEAFGIDEEMCCNRQIQGFSAGQKVRLSLAAMFWTKPHLIAIDEPTNYLDVETVEALAKALNSFRGGIVMIEPKTDFVNRICNEKWDMKDGVVTVEKMKNDNKRQA